MGTKDKMSDCHHGDELESSGSAEEPPAIPQGEWDPSVHRLPVWATIREAALAIAKEWKTLLKAIAVPALLLAAVNVVDQAFLAILGGSRLAFLLVWLLLPGGFFTMIAISCHRLVILGVDSLPNAWGLFWSWRETRFFGWIFGIGLSAGLVTFLDIPLYGSVSQLAVLVVSPPIMWYVLARLSLVLPATAIGQRPTLKGSWQLSRSNGWRLALVTFLPSLLAVIALSVGSPQLDGTVNGHRKLHRSWSEPLKVDTDGAMD